MTIGCTAVAIDCKGNVALNIFNSHARDIYGRSHPQGTYVLLEVSSLNSLVHYFQSVHNDIFELKGVNTNKVQNSTLFQSHASETRKFNVSCAVAVYSLCYSVIKSCSYWNLNTLSGVIQYGKRLYEHSSLNKYLPLDDLPKTVDVCGTEVSLDLKSDYSERILSDSVDSKSLFENLVRNNSEYTGFLMWFSVFCTTCTFQTTKRSKYVYSLLLFNESQLPLIEYAKTVNSTASLVAAISNIQKLHNAGGYNKIQFITCSAKAVVRAERKKISIIVKNGKELTSKVLLRAPRWTWQMFIQKDKTKLIKFLKITKNC